MMERNLAALMEALSAELSEELARKTSFEMRAFAVVTANLALVTIWLSLDQALGLAARVVSEFGQTPLAIMAWSAVSAVVFAVLSAVPLLQKRIVGDDWSELLNYIIDEKPLDSAVLAALVRTRIVALKSRQAANTFRAWLLLASTVALVIGVGVAAYTIAAALAH